MILLIFTSDFYIKFPRDPNFSDCLLFLLFFDMWWAISIFNFNFYLIFSSVILWNFFSILLVLFSTLWTLIKYQITLFLLSVIFIITVLFCMIYFMLSFWSLVLFFYFWAQSAQFFILKWIFLILNYLNHLKIIDLSKYDLSKLSISVWIFHVSVLVNLETSV